MREHAEDGQENLFFVRKKEIASLNAKAFRLAMTKRSLGSPK
jgi:hypothetical protein